MAQTNWVGAKKPFERGTYEDLIQFLLTTNPAIIAERSPGHPNQGYQYTEEGRRTVAVWLERMYKK
jgi:hypothetical protein